MGRLRGCLWLTAGLVVALLAGVVAFMALNSAIQEGGDRDEGAAAGPRVSVVIAAGAIPVRTALAAADLELREVPVDAVPQGAVREREQAVGKVTLVDLYPGEVILAPRLVDPNVTSGDGRLALVVAEDEVLMAIPASDLMSRVGVLKPGDRVDLLFSLDFTGGEGRQSNLVAFSLLQNVAIAAIVGGGQQNLPNALLLTVDPQDALLLKYVNDAGGTMDIVLRAPGAEQPFEVEPVDEGYMINRYRIPAGMGR
jgi:pilus assembly protein CpaB